jgi:hypothetical protein
VPRQQGEEELVWLNKQFRPTDVYLSSVVDIAVEDEVVARVEMDVHRQIVFVSTWLLDHEADASVVIAREIEDVEDDWPVR